MTETEIRRNEMPPLHQPLRDRRVWMDLGKLVLAAIVQGVVVSAVVGMVVMILASTSVSEPVNASGPVSGAPASTAAGDQEQG